MNTFALCMSFMNIMPSLFIYFLIITYPCSYGLFDYDHCYLSFKFGELYS